MNQIAAKAIALLITLTLTACEEKKKQDGTTTTATEPAAEAATQEAATQEAVAEKPAENAVGGSFTDPRDNKTYKIVKIGEQVWMAENLNYVAEGSKCYGELKGVYDEASEDYIYKPSPKDSAANCQKYGRLYDWETAKKACPSGWHLPSDKEWQTLVDFAGGVKVAGKKLKANSGWDNNGNGTDDFGFSALPGGSYLCRDGCDFYNGGIGSNWWNSSISDNDYMYIGEPDNPDKENGASYSIRCIKD